MTPERGAQLRRPGRLIVELYGTFVHHGLDSWLAVSDLIRLLGDVGVDQQAVRSAASRMKRRGTLVSETRGRRRGYALSERTLEAIHEGDSRIFGARPQPRVEDGWALAIFSVPESDRRKRHVLRSRLESLGFGNLSPGVWIAPAHHVAEAERLMRRLGLAPYLHLFTARERSLDEARRLVASSWDLDALREHYDAFIAELTPLLRKWSTEAQALDDREAFVDYVETLHRWRRFPYLDPGLPEQLLPERWPGGEAARLFFELAERVAERAMAYARSVAFP